MFTFIVIALVASLVVYLLAKKSAKPETISTPEITEQEVHEDLNSHVEPITEPTPPIVVIEPPVAAAQKKPAKKAKK
jgi:hypothetical protein